MRKGTGIAAGITAGVIGVGVAVHAAVGWAVSRMGDLAAGRLVHGQAHAAEAVPSVEHPPDTAA